MKLNEFYEYIKSDNSAIQIKNETENYLDMMMKNITSKSKNQRKTMINGILPVIAIYKALQKVGYSKDESFMIIETYINENDGKKLNRKMKRIEQIPLFFKVFYLLWYLSMNKNDNWITSRVTMKNNEICFNIHKCIYNDTCLANDSSELCKLFCNLDTIAYANMKRMTFCRTKTLASGSDICDFIFKYQ